MTRRRRPIRTAGKRPSRTYESSHSRSNVHRGRHTLTPTALVVALGQQADEFAEYHRGRSPNLMAEQIEIRIFHRDALANPGALPDPGGVAQVVERDFEDLVHFPWRRREVGPSIRQTNDRVQRKAADQDVHRRELPKNAYDGRVDADFFSGFAERRFGQRLTRIRGTAR